MPGSTVGWGRPLLSSSCTVGRAELGPQGHVGPTAASLDSVRSRHYCLDVRADDDYGQTRRASAIYAWVWSTAHRELADLEPGTHRPLTDLCGAASSDQGICGPDKTVTTGVVEAASAAVAAARSGSAPPYRHRRELSLDVLADATTPTATGPSHYGGSRPATPLGGRSTSGREARLTAFRIEGHRATVGFSSAIDFVGYEVTVILEDNGPTATPRHGPRPAVPRPRRCVWDTGRRRFTVEGG